MPEYDPRLILDYASPVEDDAEMGLRAAQAAPWAPTVDEWRVMAGQAPAEDAAVGKLHAMATGIRFGNLDDEPAPPPPAPGQPPGAPPPPGGRGLAALTADELADLRRLAAKMERRP